MEILALLPVLAALAAFNPSPSMAFVLARDKRDISTLSANLQNRNGLLQQRAPVPQLSTCGFLNGDPSRPRTADPGFNCRVDAKNGLWGFCPASVMAASDCGLAGSCVDGHGCSKACGFTDKTTLTTFTCSGTQYCSTALLTFGVDQTYSYLACGPGPSVEHYLNSPTMQTTTTESSSTLTTQVTNSGSTTISPASNGSTLFTASKTSLVPTSATTNAQPSSQDQKSNGGPNNVGAIIGGAVGGLALLCASAVAVVYLIRRHRPVASDSHAAVSTRHTRGAAGSEGFNSTPNDDEPKNLWIPSELSADPVRLPRHAELPG